MQNTQSSDQSSNPMLTKLLEVDLELADKEAELMAKLQDVQEKRKSLKTVTSMFTLADTPATAPVEEPTETPVAVGRESEPVTKVTTSLDSKATVTADSDTAAVPDTQSQEAKKIPSSASRKQTRKFTNAMKTVRQTESWQQYLREEFEQNTSLPEAVSKVLQRQSDAVMEIPAIVNAIFVDEIPKQAQTKARRQITNILSKGVTKNKWYRGQPGGYSMSKAAAAAHLTS